MIFVNIFRKFSILVARATSEIDGFKQKEDHLSLPKDIVWKGPQLFGHHLISNLINDFGKVILIKLITLKTCE